MKRIEASIYCVSDNDCVLGTTMGTNVDGAFSSLKNQRLFPTDFLLHTLKVYLVNNMNYSLTAELLFVHINTIRKRIDRIMEDTAFEGVDWNNTVERVKLILLLQFLEAGE